MNKKYIVRLSQKEREELVDIVKRLKGSAQKVRRAQVLLKADANVSNWTDSRIAESYGCCRQTVENLRRRLVTEGFATTVHGKPRSSVPRAKVLNGKQKARVIAMRLGKPAKGYANWSLRLLSERVELGIVDSISHETVRQTSKKKRHDQSQNSILGESSRCRRGVRGSHGGGPGYVRNTL